ncbi:hypothetical protein GUITHDRAFT_122487 [Guillardia theta CCMP2712]|uniref:Uncharacterized protein n=1 Tax=Guillardia theta (strain CCMP2712) TaxID=905079 RepID=L1I5H4_GUITC|nr:hypothetical protein GUITHDRAFT_122487 [Guillardia theta CCMP2712]EKX31317.1 hypothetical protein GUITHDRAFT_122487 [Guillardia theta CCMP2712]|eukprot:XP_005818297.1 hypothetical protein GUITHDRAFT_122487 [Guillardia theta CCMP2712]
MLPSTSSAKKSFVMYLNAYCKSSSDRSSFLKNSLIRGFFIVPMTNFAKGLLGCFLRLGLEPKFEPEATTVTGGLQR